MTAEIAVLNKDAIALAADSTVTITGQKTYHSINKLFSLSTTQPIGVMIYGSSEIAGVPWETLIKLYRSKLGDKSFPRLADYQSDFIEFIQTRISEYDTSEATNTILDYADDYLDLLTDKINTWVEETIEEFGTLESNDIKTQFRKIVSSHFKKYNEQPDGINFSKALVQKIKKGHSESIRELIKEKLENHEYSKATEDKIIEIVFLVYSKACVTISGIVFAGFGEEELFPSIITCGIEGIIFGKVKYLTNKIAIKNEDSEDAFVVPFAQKDIVSTFMEGISEKMFEAVTESHIKGLIVQELRIKTELSEIGVSEEDIDKVFKKLDIEDIANNLLETISKSKYEDHVNPLIRAIKFLPKSEMAEVAESLVSITSFRQKISLDQESVGGAIDVAIISKTDGFIWVKRKHYFDPQLNPGYMRRHFDESCGGLRNGDN